MASCIVHVECTKLGDTKGIGSMMCGSMHNALKLGDGPLVEHDEEDDVVAEAGEAVHGRHLDDKGKHCAGYACWVRA